MQGTRLDGLRRGQPRERVIRSVAWTKEQWEQVEDMALLSGMQPCEYIRRATLASGVIKQH